MGGFFGVGAAIEGGDAEVAFALLAEAAARGNDDVGLVEEAVEDLPGGEAGGGFDPDIGGVGAAEDLEAGSAGSFDEDAGVAHIVVDEGADLLASAGGIECFGSALDEVADAVEFGARTSEPEGVQAARGAVEGGGLEGFGDDGEGAAQASEAADLGEAAEFDGAVAGAGDFVDGVGQGGIADVGFVGGVVEEEGAVVEGVADPGSELIGGGGGAGGVVGGAEVDEVDGFFGDLRDESVRGVAREVADSLVGAMLIGGSGVSGHDVGIHVDGVDGVGDGDAVTVSEDVEDVGAIAFGAVGDKDLVVGDGESAFAEVVFRDGVAEEVVALFGAVAAEGFAGGHFVDGAVEGGDDGGGEGFGDVADAAADEAAGGFGVLVAELADASADFREEVAGFEFEVVVVEVGHGWSGPGMAAGSQRGGTLAEGGWEIQWDFNGGRGGGRQVGAGWGRSGLELGGGTGQDGWKPIALATL